jgi:hypothetical protein
VVEALLDGVGVLGAPETASHERLLPELEKRGVEPGAVDIAAPQPAQLDHPDWRFGFDEDHERSIETRRRLVEGVSDEIVFSSHSTVGWRR